MGGGSAGSSFGGQFDGRRNTLLLLPALFLQRVGSGGMCVGVLLWQVNQKEHTVAAFQSPAEGALRTTAVARSLFTDSGQQGRGVLLLLGFLSWLRQAVGGRAGG